MNSYDTVLFDLDGTLIESKLGITKSVQYSLSKFGFVENNLNDLEKFIGPPLQGSFQKYYNLNEKESWAAVEYYREYFDKKGIFENNIYDGIPELLNILKSQGKILEIATSKPTYYAKKIIENYKLDSYFAHIVGSHKNLTRISKTEIIEHALSLLRDVNKKKVIMIGDKEHDIIGAKNNNIDSIGVGYGYGSKEELEGARPTYIIPSVRELSNFFSQ